MTHIAMRRGTRTGPCSAPVGRGLGKDVYTCNQAIKLQSDKTTIW